MAKELAEINWSDEILQHTPDNTYDPDDLLWPLSPEDHVEIKSSEDNGIVQQLLDCPF